jgi:FkbM family methyltransferase
VFWVFEVYLKSSEVKKIPEAIVGLVAKIIGKKRFGRALVFSARSIDVNLHKSGLLQIGAGTNVYLENGSEQFFIKNILVPLLQNNPGPVLFDVGANVGNYTLALNEQLPGAKIYSFEPVAKTFEQLELNVGGKSNTFNIGFGSVPGKAFLYNTVDTGASELSTTHKEILSDIFKSTEEIAAIEFETDTIDNFCLKNKIEKIDFLKIDVEGNELSVLKGAEKMLANGGIKLIQFEINAHNIYARVFLRDFYLLLKDFEFFRLTADGMISLGDYKPINEIFTAQNMLAIHHTIVDQINGKYICKI